MNKQKGYPTYEKVHINKLKSVEHDVSVAFGGDNPLHPRRPNTT